MQGSFVKRGALLGAILISSVMAAPAQAANYGAIAFSPATGAHGYSLDYRSQRGAQNRALGECARRGGGCQIATWFRNACGALAVGAGNGWGAEWGNTRAEAERLALQRCSSFTSGCYVLRWVCTSR